MTFQIEEGEAEVIVTEAEEADETPAEESEDSKETKETKEAPTETPDAKRARLKRQLEQHEKKHGFKEEPSGKDNSADSDDRYNRLALRQEGIVEKDEQNIAIEYAKWKGIDVVDAIKLPAVKAELQTLRAKDVLAPSTRTAGRTTADDPAQLSKLYKAGKYLTPDQMKKVRKHLRG